MGSGVLNPGAVFLRFVTEAFLPFLGVDTKQRLSKQLLLQNSDITKQRLLQNSDYCKKKYFDIFNNKKKYVIYFDIFN